MHLHFDGVEIVDQVFLVGNPAQERRLVVGSERLPTVRPAITMHEAEVRSRGVVDEGHVAPHHGFFDLPLERQDVGRRPCDSLARRWHRLRGRVVRHRCQDENSTSQSQPTAHVEPSAPQRP